MKLAVATQLAQLVAVSGIFNQPSVFYLKLME